jgi:hypothetical protein
VNNAPRRISRVVPAASPVPRQWFDKDFHPRENERTAQERWIKDVLEDDDVPEALMQIKN